MLKRRRLLQFLALAAGAFASVATSQVSEPIDISERWALDQMVDLEPVVLDESTPRVGYHVWVVFDAPLERPSGNLTLDLNVALDPSVPGNASIHVEVVEETTGAVGSIDFVQEPAFGPAAPGLGTPAWRLDCRDGCASEFTVWIERTDEITDVPWSPATISGLFTVDLVETAGEASAPPAGSALTLEVTRIEEAP